MDFWLPFASFAVVAAITPGPNNLMLAASGVAFGWRRTVPHLLGIPVGFAALLLISGLGVGTIVTTVPAAQFALKLFGSTYLIYLAWAMRGAFANVAAGRATGRPIRFLESVVFQFANPKGWIMALSAVSVFAVQAENPWAGLAAVLVGFVAIALPCSAVWLTLGVAAERALVGTRSRRLFSGVMVVLMAYTVVSIWIE